MQVNKTIVVAVVIIMATGFYQLLVVKTVKTTMTRITVGAFMLGLIASIADLFGGGIGRLAGYLLLLAMGTALFVVIGNVATLGLPEAAPNPFSKHGGTTS